MFAIGDKVKIGGGAWEDFVGKIEELRTADGKALVQISIYGRFETVVVDLSKLKLATP